MVIIRQGVVHLTLLHIMTHDYHELCIALAIAISAALEVVEIRIEHHAPRHSYVVHLLCTEQMTADERQNNDDYEQHNE